MDYRRSRCNCSCHSDSGVYHCIPCCSSCSFCWEDRIIDREEHEAMCEENPIHLEPEVYHNLKWRDKVEFHKKCDKEADRIRLKREQEREDIENGIEYCHGCQGDGYYKGPRLGDEPCPKCKGTGKIKTCEL